MRHGHPVRRPSPKTPLHHGRSVGPLGVGPRTMRSPCRASLRTSPPPPRCGLFATLSSAVGGSSSDIHTSWGQVGARTLGASDDSTCCFRLQCFAVVLVAYFTSTSLPRSFCIRNCRIYLPIIRVSHNYFPHPAAFRITCAHGHHPFIVQYAYLASL